jgi:hypothetical protein
MECKVSDSVPEDDLFRPGPPPFFVTALDESALPGVCLDLSEAHPTAVIRVLRGKKCRSLDAFFDEAAAALQFPYYFGENWPAFDECITDLEWLPASAYLIVISNAHLLLEAEPDGDFRVLVTTFARTNIRWLTPNLGFPRSREATAFHVVFQCGAGDLPALAQRLAQYGFEAKRLGPGTIPEAS